MSSLRWRPSPAMLVAALAVTIAFVGTAAAGPIDNPIAQDSRLTKKDRRIAAKISRKISARLIRRLSPRFANRQIKRLAPKITVANARSVVNGAISTEKLADDAVTGEKINESSAPFGRIVHTATSDSTTSISGGFVDLPLDDKTYTQRAGEFDQFAGTAQVRYESSCDQPRSFDVYLLVDSPNPMAPSEADIAVYAHDNDSDSGEVTKNVALVGAPNVPKTSLFQPSSDQAHTLNLVAKGSCFTGGGVTATFGGVNVIGIR